MKTLKRVGTVAAGALMIGAALSGAVSAAMDPTGLSKDFFYDANFNPMVQIVVGEKGMATDAVAAGNVAAVIGNLAYTTSEVSPGGTASGQVVLGVSAQGATGKYEYAKHPSTDGTWLYRNSTQDFYSKSIGLPFNDQDATTSTNKEYKQGHFIQYSLACNQQQREEAGILKKGAYSNIHCLFCQTLCLGQLENPTHDQEEYIGFDYTSVNWYEDGLSKSDAEDLVLKVPSGSLTYTVTLDEVPVRTIYQDSGETSGEEVDFEWRGKMILFGEEYYVKEISGTSKI
ncbi:MAG: S-layer protein, partial [Candidatus Altiarchaeales archaeon]|nr:S-layer protein [Candidatus Altiarchaeales archaeon]